MSARDSDPLLLSQKKRANSEEPGDGSLPANELKGGGSDGDNSTKRLKFEASADHQAQAVGSNLGNDNEPSVPASTLHTIADHSFDDYNEESDQDWAEGDGSESDASSSGSELLHAALIGDGESQGDIDVDGSDDEQVYIPDWTSYTEEEMENIQEEARELGVSRFLEKFVEQQKVPVAKLLEVFDIVVEPRTAMTNDIRLFVVLRNVVCRHLRKRRRLENVNTLKDVVDLIAKSQRIMIVTGAGVSVSCGIPDFRSEKGIYSRLQEYQLDDPQQMFDIEYFREMPETFYSFAKELYPSNFEPSPSHMFVKLVEDKGKLLRNYTQNIDTLEHKANIKNVVNCHGSFATASCVACGYQCDGGDLEEHIFAQKVPPCPKCSSTPSDEDDTVSRIMKPDITFFGEQLPSTFHDLLPVDTDKVDLLIAMGSSLKVSPVSDIMLQIPHRVPQILINRTPITHMTFDVQLLGNSDDIVSELCRMLDWDLRHEKLPGGSALSEDSWKLSKEGPGDLAEGDNTDTGDVEGANSKIWQFWRDGLYTFPGAVLDERYFEAQRCDERGSRGEEVEEESIDIKDDQRQDPE